MAKPAPEVDPRLNAAFGKSFKLLIVPLALTFLATIVISGFFDNACSYLETPFVEYGWLPNYFLITRLGSKDISSICSVILLRSIASSVLLVWLILSVIITSKAVKPHLSLSGVALLFVLCSTSFLASTHLPINDIDLIRPSYSDPWAILSIKNLFFVWVFYLALSFLIFCVRCALREKGFGR
ncbi:hypothetical protein [Agrobacterium cavarae]|jgi:hypothetical protein|uniref:hypothetical protein n=1 Tax=Agrobacterium cavarae TaxID=2528239 RepID=UPI002FDAD3C4